MKIFIPCLTTLAWILAASTAVAQGGGGFSRATTFDCPNEDPGESSPGVCISPVSAGGGTGPVAMRSRLFPSKLQGGPISIARMAAFEDETDFTVPVNHGMNLSARRIYSDRYFYDDNAAGRTALGFAADAAISSNWHLYLYESRLRVLDADALLWIGPSGNWIHFGFNQTATLGDGDRLHAPGSTAWGTSFDASVFYPSGDPRAGVHAVNNRQTGEDLEAYILHVTPPQNPAQRIDPANIAELVVRNRATGRQYHYDAEGNLLFFDVNWRNNLAASHSDHVDDYLEVQWTSAYSLATQEAGVAAIDRVLAPPSDGRFLIFRHAQDPTHGALTHVESVALGVGALTFENVAAYEYHDALSGPNEGRLWRAWRGSDGRAGQQFDYGDLMIAEGRIEGADPFALPGRLALYSEITKDALGVVSAVPLLANQFRTEASIDYLAQWTADPVTGDWRAAFEVTGQFGVGWSIQWLDGLPLDAQAPGRYNPALQQTETLYTFTWARDAMTFSYADSNSPPPRLRQTYATTLWGESRRAQRKSLHIEPQPTPDTLAVLTLLIPGAAAQEEELDPWVHYESVAHVDPQSGIDRIASVTRYAGLKQDPSSDVWEIDPATVSITQYAYDDPDFPESPSSIEWPNGSRVLYDYDAAGRVARVVRLLNDGGLITTQSETLYEYSTLPHARGMLERVEYRPWGAPVRTVEYTYTASPAIAGQVRTVRVDDDVTTYTYDAAGILTATETAEGTTAYTYVANLYPPRIATVTGPGGLRIDYAWNTAGRLASATFAGGTSAESTTAYEYDSHGNISRLIQADAGAIDYTYNIYGQPLEVTGANGARTDYAYDEFGRVTSEEVIETAGSDYLYRIDYGYPGEAKSEFEGNPARWGVAAQTLISRRFTEGGPAPNATQWLSFHYDLLGRPIGAGSDAASDDFVFAYANSRLTTVSHGNGFGLWGTNEMRFEYGAYGRLHREIYPNGRYIERAYDAAGRLASFKDPFGFITSMTYDAAGNTDSVTHSSLGQADLQYDASGRLERITAGNGAATDFTRDASGRLTGLEVLDDQSASLLGLSWSLDASGRRHAYQAAAPSLALTNIDTLYDSMGRLTRENYTGGDWDLDYAYDASGNRTVRELTTAAGVQTDAFVYGAGDREVSAGSATPLAYDFRGQVTSRPSLSDGSTYAYAWDAYGRLRSATGGAADVAYDYDAGGRLMRRVRDPGGAPESTYYYWMGQDRLAEERGGDGRTVVFTDDETTTEPEDTGWGELGSSAGTLTIEYADDASRGRALHMTTTGTGWRDSKVILGDDAAEALNPNDTARAWPDRPIWAFWVRDGAVNQRFWMQILLRTIDGAQTERERWITYKTENGTDNVAGNGNLRIFTGLTWKDGAWHYFERDLEADLDSLITGEDVVEVSAVLFQCNDLYIDDMTLGTGRLDRTYQLNRGVASGGYLGAQAGAAGAGAGLGAGAAWYYHASDLGTVLATTGAAGAAIDVSVPDFFGNYDHALSPLLEDGVSEPNAAAASPASRPDWLGHQSKFFDPDAGLYHFGARWYDPERGRWMSPEPSGRDGPNLYHFVLNAPTIATDPDGESVILVGGAIIAGAAAIGAGAAIISNPGFQDAAADAAGAIGGAIEGFVGGLGDAIEGAIDSLGHLFFPRFPPRAVHIPAPVPIPLPIPIPIPIRFSDLDCETPEEIELRCEARYSMDIMACTGLPHKRQRAICYSQAMTRWQLCRSGVPMSDWPDLFAHLYN